MTVSRARPFSSVCVFSRPIGYTKLQEGCSCVFSPIVPQRSLLALDPGSSELKMVEQNYIRFKRGSRSKEMSIKRLAALGSVSQSRFNNL